MTQEKIKRYEDLKRKITTMWGIKKVEVMPVVIGTVTKKSAKWMKIGVQIIMQPRYFGLLRVLEAGRIDGMHAPGDIFYELPIVNIRKVNQK